MDDLKTLLLSIFAEQTMIQVTLSTPRKDLEVQKVTIRPITLKNVLFYQWTEWRGKQTLHRNLSPILSQDQLEQSILNFKQTLICTKTADYHVLTNKKNQLTILKKPPSHASISLKHNRKKHYLLEEGDPIPFLIALGVMNAQGKVLANKYDKFRQINRFVEMIDDVLSYLPQDQPLHLVDFGCGKAYLTFALYHYLKMVKNYSLRLVGLDLKADVIQQCQDLAKKLGYEDLHFQLGDINSYHTSESVDMVVSLHACDTATDAAIEKAIHWQSKVILCVPCCQHELIPQVANDALEPLLKHGILRERFAALVTDAARAQLLEAMGYRTQILEFIDLEHTPKNLLIRAIKGLSAPTALEAYKRFKELLHIDPSLERRFHKMLQ